MIMPSGLTDAQETFISEYLKDLNAQAAARRMGYEPGLPARNAAKGFLKSQEVRQAIRSTTERMIAKRELSAERIIEEICRHAFANIHNFLRIDEDGEAHIDLSTAGYEKFSAVRKIITTERTTTFGKKKQNRTVTRKTTLELSDPRPYLQMLGDYYRLFPKTVEIMLKSDVFVRIVVEAMSEAGVAADKMEMVGASIVQQIKALESGPIEGLSASDDL